MTTQIILWVGFVIMALATIGFFSSKSKFGFLAGSVTATTLLSYAVMLEGSLVLQAGDETIYFTRWMFYILSCSILMHSISDYLGVKGQAKISVLILNALVMISGALAAVTGGISGIFLFLLGSVFFVFQIWSLRTHTTKKRHRSFIFRYIFTGWSMFPIIFLLAPEGFGLISTAIAAGCYLALDFYTKIFFYLDLAKK